MNKIKEDKPIPLFLAGFPRCASTTITSILNTHPEICFPKTKGSNFFSTDEYLNGESYYSKNYFPHWSGEKYIADGNPVHSFLPYVTERIYTLYPKAKIILSIREPVARAYSNWWHNKQAGLENLSFEETIMEEIDFLQKNDLNYWKNYRKNMLGGKKQWRKNIRHYLFRGYYSLHIKRFLEYFDKTQIHIISFEEFKENPSHEISKILNFLDLELQNEVDTSIHTNYAVKNESILSFVNFLRRFGIIERIPTYFVNSIKYTINSLSKKTEIDEGLRDLIKEHYKDKNADLRSLLS